MSESFEDIFTASGMTDDDPDMLAIRSVDRFFRINDEDDHAPEN